MDSGYNLDPTCQSEQGELVCMFMLTVLYAMVMNFQGDLAPDLGKLVKHD